MRFAVVLLLVSFAAAVKGKSAAPAVGVGRPFFFSRGPRKVSCSKYKVLTASDGYIGTSGSKYGNFESCSWKIIVPATKRVRLHFVKFDLEYGSSTCPFDKVKVFDGSDAKATLKGTYCGNKKPKDIISKGNTIFVTFSTDYSVVKSGFRIRFSVVSCNTLDVITGYYDRKHIGTSGAHYGNYEYCTWRITAPAYWHVTIKRVSFDLEPHAFCHYDYVKIYDGTSNSAPLRGTYCGTNFPEHLMSHGRSFFIEFKSDFSVTKPGFTFSVWRSVDAPG